MRTQDLTPRESEVVALVCEEHTRAHIASTLGIAVRTVDEHVESAVRKIPPDQIRRGGRLRSIRIYYGRTPLGEAANG